MRDRQEQGRRTGDHEIYNKGTRRHDIHHKRFPSGGEGRGFGPKTVSSFQIIIAIPGTI